MDITISHKLNAVMICLMVATSVAALPSNNTVLLSAYTRHAVEASQDVVAMTKTTLNNSIVEQQTLSDHYIRMGRHLQLLNQNLDQMEKTILDNEYQFVNGDWSKNVEDLQTKLNGMGYRLKLRNPSATTRARSLAQIKKFGLRQYLRLIGVAAEQQGSNYVSPYAYYMNPSFGNARLVPVILPLCRYDWRFAADTFFAAGAIVAAFGQEPEAMALGAIGGVFFFTGAFCA